MFKLQKRATFKNGSRRTAFNIFYVDSHYIYAKKEEFLSEDAVNVSTDEEDATKCCSKAKQCSSPQVQGRVGLSGKTTVLVLRYC